MDPRLARRKGTTQEWEWCYRIHREEAKEERCYRIYREAEDRTQGTILNFEG
jgi:hypothetical protein